MVLLFSCSISKQTEKAANIAFNSSIVTQKVMTKALVESTSAIYKKDSLKHKTPIYIHSLIVSFTAEEDSFVLSIDSIRAFYTNDTTMTFNKVSVISDSIIYHQVAIPSHNTYLGIDPVYVNVFCKYLPNMEIINCEKEFKCLSADYIIEKQSITKVKGFQKCEKTKDLKR